MNTDKTYTVSGEDTQNKDYYKTSEYLKIKQEVLEDYCREVEVLELKYWRNSMGIYTQSKDTRIILLETGKDFATIGITQQLFDGPFPTEPKSYEEVTIKYKEEITIK